MRTCRRAASASSATDRSLAGSCFLPRGRRRVDDCVDSLAEFCWTATAAGDSQQPPQVPAQPTTRHSTRAVTTDRGVARQRRPRHWKGAAKCPAVGVGEVYAGVAGVASQLPAKRTAVHSPVRTGRTSRLSGLQPAAQGSSKTVRGRGGLTGGPERRAVRLRARGLRRLRGNQRGSGRRAHR